MNIERQEKAKNMKWLIAFQSQKKVDFLVQYVNGFHN